MARPLLFSLAPETAHEMTLKALEAGLYPRPTHADDPRLAQSLLGLDFPNPFGIAAGFDKDARVPDAVLGMGFGFAEIGSVTPLAQAGNPRPRVFRLVEDHALINRLGFNNAGHAAALGRLAARAPRGVVGVNIGANKDAEDRVADYVAGLRAFNAVASYFTVNVSSPNTPGLRDLQAPKALDELLTRVMATRAELAAAGPRRPVVLKLAPDVADDDLAPILELVLRHGVDAIAVANTTLARPGLKDRLHAREAGGLSGRPLFQRSTRMLARVYRISAGRVPLIGIGGVDSGASALAKIEAGASLIQLYTGLVYEGPALLEQMKEALCTALTRSGASSPAALAGRRAQHWAEVPLEAEG